MFPVANLVSDSRSRCMKRLYLYIQVECGSLHLQAYIYIYTYWIGFQKDIQ